MLKVSFVGFCHYWHFNRGNRCWCFRSILVGEMRYQLVFGVMIWFLWYRSFRIIFCSVLDTTIQNQKVLFERRGLEMFFFSPKKGQLIVGWCCGRIVEYFVFSKWADVGGEEALCSLQSDNQPDKLTSIVCGQNLLKILWFLFKKITTREVVVERYLSWNDNWLHWRSSRRPDKAPDGRLRRSRQTGKTSKSVFLQTMILQIFSSKDGKLEDTKSVALLQIKLDLVLHLRGWQR